MKWTLGYGCELMGSHSMDCHSIKATRKQQARESIPPAHMYMINIFNQVTNGKEAEPALQGSLTE